MLQVAQAPSGFHVERLPALRGRGRGVETIRPAGYSSLSAAGHTAQVFVTEYSVGIERRSRNV